MNATHHMIMGHESVGAVVEIGPDVTNVKVGDRVVIDPTQFCGKCHYCRRGLTCYCETFEDWQLGIGAHGTFAEYYVGEDRFMYRIPDSMEWERATLVEPLLCAECCGQGFDSAGGLGLGFGVGTDRTACANDGEKTGAVDGCD